MSYYIRTIPVFFASIILLATPAHAATVAVDCVTGHELSAAVSMATPNTTLDVSGVCNGPIHITTNDLILVGDGAGTNAVIQKPSHLPFPQDVVVIDGAVRVTLSGFDIQHGLVGVKGNSNASFSLDGVNVIDNIIGVSLDSANTSLNNISITGTTPGSAVMGLNLENGASTNITGEIEISGMVAFAINVQTNASMTLKENAVLRSHDNLMGGQISVSSSFFAERNSESHFYDNSAIGFSVNTGSTGMLFNARFFSHNNGLDGLDVVSASNFELDGDSRVVSEFNGREGISIDDSTFNMFGFFSTQPDLPNVTSNSNGANGVLVESSSKLDVGRNASITTLDNVNAGVLLDDGSSAVIQKADINNNNAALVSGNSRKKADIVATFGSRMTFNETISIGFVSCDKSSYARGDVRCNHPN